MDEATFSECADSKFCTAKLKLMLYEASFALQNF
jgi:hypothetical protein